MAKPCKEGCNFLLACQLLLPLSLLHSRSCLEYFRRRPQALYPWTSLRQLGQGHQWRHTNMNHLLSLNCMFGLFFSYLSIALPGIVWTLEGYWGLILLTYVAELVFCLFLILPYDIRRQIIPAPIPPKKHILLVGHNHRSSFLKLMELMDIFLLQVKIVMLNKWSPFLFQRECVPFPTWVFLGCSQSFLLQVWFAAIGNGAQHMSSTQNALYRALIVSSARLSRLHQLSLLILGA